MPRNQNEFVVLTMEQRDASTGNTITAPVPVNRNHLRSFNPRKPGQGEGTRLTFSDGNGFAVREPINKVCELLGINLPEGAASGWTPDAPVAGTADLSTTDENDGETTADC